MGAEQAHKEEIKALEDSLRTLEEDLQTHYCQLGKSILDMADREKDAIDTLIDDIIQTRWKLAHARHEKQCQQCMALNEGCSKFCKRCGASLPAQREREDSDEKESTEA